MFERYTEKARRVVFFARYEASQFGSPYIETAHLLLGLLREDKALAGLILRSNASVEPIRKEIEARSPRKEYISTSVDLPLSDECKRILKYAAEEAERLGHKHIGTEHLLLGILREERCFAAEILHARRVSLSAVRVELAHSGYSSVSPPPRTAPQPSCVTITSTPTGANIEIDGAFLGHTPADLPLAAGEVKITITKKGYKPWERKLTVLLGGRHSISAELEQESE